MNTIDLKSDMQGPSTTSFDPQAFHLKKQEGSSDDKGAIFSAKAMSQSSG